MKARFLILFSLIMASVNAQTRSELSFDSNVPDSEDHYVAVPRENPEDGLGFGFIYYDDFAGYTYRILGSLTEENGKLKYTENPDAKTGMMVQRIGNLDFKAAKIPAAMLKKFGVPETPEWLASYKIGEGTKEEGLVNRASSMNAGRFPHLALPVLQKLYSSGYRSKKFYFEMAFSHNAMGEFPNAEKIAKEAIDRNMATDEIYKEYIYSLLNQKKTEVAEKFLSKHLEKFSNKRWKAEAVNNIIAFSAQTNRTDIAKKWLPVFREIAANTVYEKNIPVLEKIIQENDTPSK